MAAQMQGLDTLYKPWGMMAGGMVGSREADMEAANLLGLEESQLANLIKQVEARRAQSDFARPGLEEARQLGLQGQYGQQQAAGELALGTLRSNIGAANAANTAKKSGSELENQINYLDNAVATMEANGPLGVSMVMQQLPPSLQQLAQQTGSNFPVALKKVSEMLKYQRSQTPTHIGAMEKEAFKQEGEYITEDMKQQEANLRNREDNSARAADRALQREVSNERKKEAAAQLNEDKLTRRLVYNKDKLKLLSKEYSDKQEELSMPMMGMPKPQREARINRINKEMEDIKKEALELRTEMERLEALSTFAPKPGTIPVPTPSPAAGKPVIKLD